MGAAGWIGTSTALGGDGATVLSAGACKGAGARIGIGLGVGRGAADSAAGAGKVVITGGNT